MLNNERSICWRAKLTPFTVLPMVGTPSLAFAQIAASPVPAAVANGRRLPGMSSDDVAKQKGSGVSVMGAVASYELGPSGSNAASIFLASCKDTLTFYNSKIKSPVSINGEEKKDLSDAFKVRLSGLRLPHASCSDDERCAARWFLIQTPTPATSTR